MPWRSVHDWLLVIVSTLSGRPKERAGGNAGRARPDALGKSRGDEQGSRERRRHGAVRGLRSRFYPNRAKSACAALALHEADGDVNLAVLNLLHLGTHPAMAASTTTASQPRRPSAPAATSVPLPSKSSSSSSFISSIAAVSNAAPIYRPTTRAGSLPTFWMEIVQVGLKRLGQGVQLVGQSSIAQSALAVGQTVGHSVLTGAGPLIAARARRCDRAEAKALALACRLDATVCTLS